MFGRVSGSRHWGFLPIAEKERKRVGDRDGSVATLGNGACGEIIDAAVLGNHERDRVERERVCERDRGWCFIYRLRSGEEKNKSY